MMKKFLVLILVLAMTSAVSAGTAWFQVAEEDEATSYEPSDTITIEIEASEDTVGLIVGAIISNNGGNATTPLWIASYNITANSGNVTNATERGVYVLVKTVEGMAIGSSVAAGVIHKFDYHIPDVEESTYITISAHPDSTPGETPWQVQVSEADGGKLNSINCLTIHVVPEPMTIALLGLGGLFLRRRRK